MIHTPFDGASGIVSRGWQLVLCWRTTQMQTILLIDSCPLTRECLSTILRVKGYRVQSAALISQAKTMIAKRPPELLITEIRLPDDNALNLMRWLKSDPKFSKTRVCMLTNAPAKKPIMEAIELGASKVILKSKFTIAGFIEQINTIVSERTQAAAGPSTQPAEQSELRYLLPEPAPDPALALKEIKPIITRSQLNEQLEELEELRTLPEPTARVLEAIDSPEVAIELVADLIKMDQVLALKIMKLANSSTYARTEETLTLKDAVLRIGLEHLRELIVGIQSLENAQESPEQACSFDQQLFWEHALGVAVCSSKIARHCQGLDPETVFTAAILHDIGRMILLQTFPGHYAQVLDRSHTLGIALELVEKRLLLSDHTLIAQTVLGNANLPKDLVDAIANHHTPPAKLGTKCPKSAMLAATIELGDRLIHAMGIGSSGNRTISPTEELFILLESSDLCIGTIVEGLDEQIDEMRSLIFEPAQSPSVLATPNSPAFDRAFHPIYLTMEPEHDAIGHWVMSHRDKNGNEADGQDTTPNIAIIHARQAKDRQALAELLIEAQSKITPLPGAGALPVLILSPTGKIALPDEVLTRHPSMHLMTPFSVLHFEQRVNHLLNGLIRPQENWAPRKSA